MQLTGKEISNFIEPAAEERIRAASYDVGIGSVMLDGDTYEAGDQLPALKPQQMAIFISEETIQMPEGHVGYALPRTKLCNDGVLTLSTGIIDPGWNGRISTIAINFDSTPQAITRGEGFLRVVAHSLSDQGVADPDILVSERAYLNNRRKESLTLPTTFLDLENKVESVARRITRNQTGWFVIWLGIASVFVILATTLLGPYLSDYGSEIESLRDRVRTLEVRSAGGAEAASDQLRTGPLQSGAPSSGPDQGSDVPPGEGGQQ